LGFQLRARRAIANNSRPGQGIYDPFLGSGTSFIADEMSGRICYGWPG
jgi:DNA modification methylase